MSSFYCEHCGTAIEDTPRGYVTGCEHYPLEKIDPAPEAKRAAAMHAAVFGPQRRPASLRQLQAQVRSIGSDAICIACNQPTMHDGNLCYSCTQRSKE